MTSQHSHTMADALHRYLSETHPVSPLLLRSTLKAAAEPGEIAVAWDVQDLPEDLIEFWLVARSARLFEDVTYGQWGLVLLDPDASARRSRAERANRPTDFSDRDIVIAEFLGDSDLLVYARGDQPPRILVGLPLDERDLWYGAADSLREFLDRFADAQGEKFWEA